MIIQGVITAVLALGVFVIGLVPKLASLPFVGAENLRVILGYALWFFPIEMWIIAISNICFWIVAMITWSVIEWAYKKIPGVD